MKLKRILLGMMWGSWLASCMHVQNTNRFTSLDYGDSMFVKSPDIDKVWKPTYQYAILLPKDAGRDVYAHVGSLLSSSFTPQNTLVFGDISNTNLNLLPKGTTVCGYILWTRADSLGKSPVLWVTIENVQTGAEEEYCNYKLVKKDTLFISK